MAAALRPERSFIGRVEVVDALRRRSDAAVGGTGGFTLIEGDVGVGKSTLIDFLVPEIRARGVRVLLGRVSTLDNPPPLHLIRNALDTEPDESAETPVGEASPLALAPVNPAEAVSLELMPQAEYVPTEARWPVTERLLEAMNAPSEMAESSRGRLFALLATRLLTIARKGPTMLLLEDLHLADESSLDFLAYLAPQLGRSPLWVAATTLPVSTLGEPRRGALERLQREARADVVVVRPFTAGEVIEFVRTVDGGGPVAVEDVTRWHSQTGGNPQFIEQLLRSRRAFGKVEEPLAIGRLSPLEVAQYLQRLGPTLGEDEQRTMRLAAILGHEFPFSLLLQATGEDEERLSEVIERLVARGILRERPEERLEFTREDLRGEIYSTLSDTRRRLLHRRAAEAIERTGPADLQTIFALARHYYLARVDDKAAAYNRLAGEFSARAFSPTTARQHLERALETYRRARPDDLSGEVEITLELASQLDRVGELKPAETLLRDALAREPMMRAAGPTQRALVKIYLTRILTDQGRWDEADRLTEELLGSAETRTSPAAMIAVHRLRGELLYYNGRYVEALRHHDEALALARSIGDPRDIALETVRRANVLGMIPGRVEEAIEAYRQAREQLLRIGDRSEAAYALLFLGVVLSQHGRTPEGLDALGEALKLAEEAHDLRRVGWALFNIADLQQESHLLDEASAANRRSREVLTEVGDRFGLVQVYITEGKILLQRGDWRAAEIELLEAFRLVRELRTPADELDVVLRLAEVQVARGDLDGARARVEELGRKDIKRLRPDIAEDYERLKERVARPGDDAAPHPP